LRIADLQRVMLTHPRRRCVGIDRAREKSGIPITKRGVIPGR
jgi:hypothetical protein